MKHSHVKDYKGRLIPQHQHQGHPDRSDHQLVNVPPETQGTFGQILTYSFKEKNGRIKSATVELNLSALTKGGGSTFARFAPSITFYDKIEIEANGTVFATLYPEEQYNTNRLLRDDVANTYFKKLIGDIDNASRNSASTTPQTLFIPIHSLLDTTQVFIPDFFTSDIKIKVYLRPLIQCVEYDGAAPSGSVVASSLKVKFEKLHASKDALELRASHLSNAHHYSYLEPVIMRGEQLLAGSTTLTVPLRGIIGPVSWMYFTLRDQGQYGDETLIYKTIESFEILDSSNANITGRQQITDVQNRVLLAHDIFPGSYPTEKPVYTWSFSERPLVSSFKGTEHGAQSFTGNEKLIIRLATPLASNAQIDIVAFCHSTLTMSGQNLRVDRHTRTGKDY